MPNDVNDLPSIRESHELRDHIADLVEESIIYDAAICHGITLGRKRALNRTQGAEQAGADL